LDMSHLLPVHVRQHSELTRLILGSNCLLLMAVSNHPQMLSR